MPRAVLHPHSSGGSEAEAPTNYPRLTTGSRNIVYRLNSNMLNSAWESGRWEEPGGIVQIT